MSVFQPVPTTSRNLVALFASVGVRAASCCASSAASVFVSERSKSSPLGGCG